MTEQQPVHSLIEDAGEVPDPWRNEVQARLARYKRRRGRRIEGAFTMRFPFPPDEPEAPAPESAELSQVIAVEAPAAAEPAECEIALNEVREIPVAVEDESSSGSEDLEPEGPIEVESPPPEIAETLVSAAEPAPEPEPEEVSAPAIELPPRPRPRRKVIAFPTPSFPQQEALRRIADPVQPEQLRILDVPEELQAMPATPFLEGLLDAPPSAAPASAAEAVDLPCAAVKSSRRLGAALIDTVAVLAGAAMFVAVASRFVAHDLPPTKFLVAGALAICVLLWASYQYLFLVYGGSTLGMKLTRIGLRTFQGRGLTLRQRQSRVMALYLSVLSLGMGVLWSFVDIEGLCWHDRISQTFPAPAAKS